MKSRQIMILMCLFLVLLAGYSVARMKYGRANTARAKTSSASGRVLVKDIDTKSASEELGKTIKPETREKVRH